MSNRIRRGGTLALTCIAASGVLSGCGSEHSTHGAPSHSAPATTARASGSTGTPTLTIGRPITTGTASAPVSSLLLGALGHWFDQDEGGWDPGTQSAYPAFVRALRATGVTSVRYPSGTAANLFQWKRAIGPVSARTPQVGLSADGYTAPEDDDFGPDEFGAQSESLGQQGDILVNFATSTPTDAAEEVDYLTGKVGAERINGVDWADLRARSGHPKPYDMPYWEVGNEAALPNQLYWRSGKSSESETRLYAFGGSTAFTRERVGTFDDDRATAAVSSGGASQRFQALYPPIAPGTGHVDVGGAEWTQTADLAAAPAGAHDYSLDDATGAIAFGGGSHGAAPAKGAVITISYTSGPHAGFTAFYAAMKRANPAIHVCAGLSAVPQTDQFVAMMGTAHPYDCLQHHAYIGLKSAPPIPTDQSPIHYYLSVLAAEPAQVGEVGQIEHSVDAHAGARAGHIDVAVTEYGQVGFPQGDATFQQSLAQTIFMADDLEAWMRLGVPEADKSTLNGFEKGAQPAGEAVPDQVLQDSMILRASPTHFVITPTGELPALVRPLAGGRLQQTSVSPDPPIIAPGGQRLTSLQVVASRLADGTIELLVVNQRPVQTLTARIDPGFAHGAQVQMSTLDGPALTSINTATRTPVTVKTRSLDVGSGDFTDTFPAHSVTRIAISPARSTSSSG